MKVDGIRNPRSLILDPCLCLLGDYLVIPTMGLGEDLLELCPGIEQANQTDGLLGLLRGVHGSDRN